MMPGHTIFRRKAIMPFLLVAIAFIVVISPFFEVGAHSAQIQDAIVLVNSESASYDDFDRHIKPYLDNFGIPYAIHDIAWDPVTEEIVDRALIIVGHNGLDETGFYLDTTEQSYISGAVSGGAGLVNFDNHLSDPGFVPCYQYVQDVLDLTYGPNVEAMSVEFGESGGNIRINCWEDAHQDPVLTTFTNPTLLNDQDGQWDEFDYTRRPYPTILAGHNEWENNGLQPIHFFADGIPNGSYEVWANLYTGRHTRHYYGFTEAEALAGANWVDNVASAGGSDQHEEYSLGIVEITDGNFNLWVGDGDLIDGAPYFYGWAWIRLMPEEGSSLPLHYITNRHDVDEIIELKNNMTVLGMTPPADAEVLVAADGEPFIVVREYGQGKAVQWGSYAFTQLDIKGYVYGLDDLVWRSLVWAARKPFAMQGMPPLLPFRIDDCSGPFWWAEDAAAHGLKPWMGLFLHDMSETDTAQLKALIDNLDATASIHAFTNSYFFYYNHGSGDYTDAEIAAHFAEGTQWHQDNGIPISKYILGHYYELGTNVFDGLEDWGVEFVGTHMLPGTGYGSPWLEIGPYRNYVSGSSRSGSPVYYADFLTVPGYPEHDNKFFNVVTEIRDNAGYEWYPDNDVNGSIERGVTQLSRAFDSMVLATLFTHERFIQALSQSNWNTILEGVLDGVASYDPMYVTMDEAAQYVRAIVTSDIADSEYDPDTNVMTTTVIGETDVPTQYHLFTEDGSTVLEQRIDVPVFSGSTQVITQLPDELHRMEVSPALVTLGFNNEQQFEAQGYDVNDVPVYTEYTWDVVSGGGTIDQNGIFTAGATAGIFADTVTASAKGITGTATVVVEEFSLDHFAFDPVGDQVAGAPFTITITALGAGGVLVTSYDGTATLTDTTGTISATSTGSFVDGLWAGEVTINQEAADVVITAQDSDAAGSSNLFTVTASSGDITINLWEDAHQDPTLTTFTDPALLNDHDGQWDEFDYTSRPYPTILAGHNEWENNGLQPMHFFADGIPNGSYEVWANLYTGRHTRHYYGFSEAEALAETRWVDNVASAGGSDQHEEYSLGIVEITDGTFDLWVGDGDLIDGAPYFYGWAWIRLESVVPVEVDHFVFEPVGDQIAGVPFTICITTMDNAGLPVTTYNAAAILTDTTGTIAPTLTGSFVNGLWTGEVTINQASTGVVISAQDGDAVGGSNAFTVTEPGELHRIEVSPALVTIGFNNEQQFEAQGYDVNDVPVYTEYTWDVVSGGGTIDQNGLFTSDSIAGTFVDTVTANAEDITGSATVIVEEVSIDHFAFNAVGNQIADVPFTISITALDAGGLLVTSYDGTATLTDTTGTISPTSSGPFVNGLWTGEVTINQESTDVVITAQDSDAAGSSNLFTVTESSDDITINLWEDTHQDPVLTTFTNSALLDPEGWNEFWWSRRDYPAVFGHTSNKILPVMRFYASVPNETYDIIANIYGTLSNGYRYYYSFDPTDLDAYSIDVINQNDFSQHNLGTVDVTNGQFELYVQKADLLSGTDYYFGWAWIELVPQN